MIGIPRSARAFVVGLGLVCLAAPALAQPPDGPPPMIRHFFRLPALFEGKPTSLEAMEIRPRGPGPFPLAVIAHGTPASSTMRQAYTVEQYTVVAIEFARRGFAVTAFMRRGYGASQGGYAENTGPCGQSRYVEAGMESARDLAEAIRVMGAQPHVDPRRVLVVGQSAGGFAALALAAQPPQGLVGVISFAGGRGYFPQRNAVCEPEKLVQALGQFGRTARVPSLWIFAENDHSFPPDLARAMAAAYRSGGGAAELSMLGSFGADGHLIFTQGIDLWRPPVDAFLKRLGLPVLPPPPPLRLPGNLTDRARNAFLAYAAAAQPNKVFALGDNGAFAWRADILPIESVRTEAMGLCQRHEMFCTVASEVIGLIDE